MFQRLAKVTAFILIEESVLDELCRPLCIVILSTNLYCLPVWHSLPKNVICCTKKKLQAIVKLKQ